MIYNKLQLTDFVQNDHFELNAYIIYLFMKLDTNRYHELTKHKQ